MPELTLKPQPLDKLLTNADNPLRAGDRSLTFAARLKGWYVADANETASVRGAWLRIVPLEAIVRHPDGSEQRLAITDATGAAVQGIVRTGLLVAGVCAILIAVMKVLHTLSRKKE